MLIKTPKYIEEVTSIKCDKCGVVHDEEMHMQEFISIEHYCGYLSTVEDGVKLQLDLCESCWKQILLPYARLMN